MRILPLVATGVLASLAFAAAPAPLSLPNSFVVIETPKGAVRLHVEVAADDRSRMRGLMYRTQLAADAGMLFDFHNDGFRDFWMKDTVLPLDMIFIRADGTIASIAPNTTPYSEKVISSQAPVRAVLEINAGRAAALDIHPGEKVHNAVFANALAGQ
jgi:uncharacterized membrane protein (UPF0127 family)